MSEEREEPASAGGSDRARPTPRLPAGPVMLVLALAAATYLSAQVLFAPRPTTNAWGATALVDLVTAETLFREGDRDGDGILDYGTMGELEAAKLLGPSVARASAAGYELGAAPWPDAPYARFVAFANPNPARLPGAPALCVTQDGIVYQRATAFRLEELLERCEVPPDATPLPDVR